jgi:hypothetical protein
MPENWKINYAAIYDKAGNFWRAYWQSQKCVTVRSGGGQEEEGYCFTMTMGINDLKTYYWTLGYFDAVLLNRGLDPNIFSPTALGK